MPVIGVKGDIEGHARTMLGNLWSILETHVTQELPITGLITPLIAFPTGPVTVPLDQAASPCSAPADCVLRTPRDGRRGNLWGVG